MLRGAARLLAAGCLAAPVSAQTMRDFSAERSLRGERQFRAVVEFAAGTLQLRPGTGEHLYGLALRYDAERFAPLGKYDPRTAEARLGVTSLGRGGVRIGRRDALPQAAVIELAPAVPLSLDVTLGATESRLELGGLALRELDVKTGASRTTIAFGAPVEGSCRAASITSGAGELQVVAMGNSRCRSWRLEGGVGAVTLDLAGDWPAEARLSLQMALGGVTLEAPRGLGVRVNLRGFLAGFEAEGFEKRSGVWESANWAGAARRVEVDVASALGGVRVEWK